MNHAANHFLGQRDSGPGPDVASTCSPLVIGATGGSGTRVLARLLLGAGMYLGARRNASEDALDFGALSDRWINTYLRLRGTRLWPVLGALMRRGLRNTLARHLAAQQSPGLPWGWKEPRSIYLLPFLHSQLPAMKFVHLVRDGRDMALSQNQNQLRRHGRAALGRATRAWPPPVRSIALWSRVNAAAADYGESRMAGRYLHLRFEDLCAEPALAAGRLLAFAGLQADAGELARREVSAPATLGRWRALEPALRADLERAGRPALLRFGYLDA